MTFPELIRQMFNLPSLDRRIINFSLIIGLIIAVWLLFGDAFTTSFFQDDWFSLKISNVKIWEIGSFFIPRSDVIYYRPLGMQFPFFLSQKIFGLNPLPFRIVTLSLHLVNGWFVYKILKYLLKSKSFSVIGSFFYLTSMVHLVIFYWAATFAFVLFPAFYFGSLWCYMNRKSVLTSGLLIVGLFVNELMVTLPISLTVWELIYNNRNWRRLFWFWVPVIFYFIFRLHFSNLPVGGNYAIINSWPELLKNLRNYFLWLFQWPEEFSNQFVNFYSLNPIFIRYHKNFVWLFGIATGVYSALIFFLAVRISQKKLWTGSLWRHVGLGSAIFVSALMPVIFFSQHAFAYYLPIPLFGFLIISLAIIQTWIINSHFSIMVEGIIVAGLMILWFASSWMNLQFNLVYHWAPRRAKIAKNLITQIKQKFPKLPTGAILVIPLNSDKSENNRWALGDMNALQILDSDPKIITVYGEKDNALRSLDPNYSVPETKIFVLK